MMNSILRMIAVLLMLGAPEMAAAADSARWDVGVRIGTDASGVAENYTVGELFLLRQLPWQFDLGNGQVRTRLDLGGGYLEADGDRGGWLAAGIDLVYFPGLGPIELEMGLRPAWLTDYTYGHDDFGCNVQFITHAGVALQYRGMTIGYRFQHMSNAGLDDHNPGIEMHLVSLSSRF